MNDNLVISLPDPEVGETDVRLVVTSDGSELGRLTVTEGNVVWTPTGSTRGYALSWTAVDRLMRQHGGSAPAA